MNARHAAAAAAVALLAAACGTSHPTAARPATATTAPLAAMSSCASLLHDGRPVELDRLALGCTVRSGGYATFLSYTCKDGTTLVTADDPEGWTRHVATAGASVWHAEPWQPAHADCYAQAASNG